MNTTTNYGLKQPEITDLYDIQNVTNENMDTIDSELKGIEDRKLESSSEIKAVTEEGFFAGAKGVKELYNEINTNLGIESGNFTPSFTGLTNAGNPTYAVTNSGYYYKIGKMCFVVIIISITAKGGATGRLRIGGLPFTSNPNVSNPSLAKTQLIGVNYASYMDANFFVLPNSKDVLAVWQTALSVTSLDTSSCAETTIIALSGWYPIA